MKIGPDLWPAFASKFKYSSGCWIWTRYRDANGYGKVGVDGASDYAHRVAYRLLIGEIPQGLVIDHLCRTPECVNPYHMEAVTLGENSRRGTGTAGRDHCIHGHPFSGPNLYLWRDRRHCRSCMNRRWREQQARRVAA